MKKIIIWLAITVFALTPLTLVGCANDGNVIRLSEVTHSIFYAPMYIAINNGYFEEEGIKIELTNGGGADKVMTAIASGGADIGLMGPEATIYCHVEGQKNYPVIFGQLTKRDGSFLVSRTKIDNFEWSMLKGKHLLAGRAGGVPAMTLQYVVENAGKLALNELNFDTSVPFDMMVGAFEGDASIDFCTMFEPIASSFEAEGKGYVVASVGEASGEVPYTAFSASRSFIDKNPDLCKAFLRAIAKGYEYLKNNDKDIVADALLPSFPGTDKKMIASSVQRYLDIDAWSDSLVMKEAAFERLQDIMQNAGTLTSRADFKTAVDNSLANSL